MARRRQLVASLALGATGLDAQAGLMDWLNGAKLGEPLPEHDGVFLGEPPRAGGRLQLIDFWATWCGPCVASLPRLNAIHAQFDPEGLRVIGVTDEAPEVVRAWLTRHAVAYAIAAGGSRPLKKTMGIRALPYGLLVRSDRTLVWRGQPAELTDALLAKYLAAA